MHKRFPEQPSTMMVFSIYIVAVLLRLRCNRKKNYGILFLGRPLLHFYIQKVFKWEKSKPVSASKQEQHKNDEEEPDLTVFIYC